MSEMSWTPLESNPDVMNKVNSKMTASQVYLEFGSFGRMASSRRVESRWRYVGPHPSTSIVTCTIVPNVRKTFNHGDVEKAKIDGPVKIRQVFDDDRSKGGPFF